MIPQEITPQEIIQNSMPRYRRFGPSVKKLFEDVDLDNFFKPGASVLEIGCGSGKTITELCALYNIKGYGVDLSIGNYVEPPIPTEQDLFTYNIDRYERRLIERKRLIEDTQISSCKKIKYDLLFSTGLRSRPELLVADVQNLPFDSNKFDRIFSYRVLQYVPDKLLAISEIHRVLKIDGMAVIDFFAPRGTSSINPSIDKILEKYPQNEQVKIINTGYNYNDYNLIVHKKFEEPLIFPKLKDVRSYLKITTISDYSS